jgi:DnaJ-class molecular chaperone
LAKKHHPDRVGPSGAKQFCRINEAYETLSDLDKREAYDAELEHSVPIDRAEPSRPSAFVRKDEPEPLIPKSAGMYRASRAAVSISDNPSSVSPSMEALIQRFVRNYSGLHIPKGEKPEALNINIGVSAAEAAHGLELPIGVPTFQTCTICRGTGQDWMFPCMNCMSQGLVQHEELITIRIPPFRGSDAVFDISIRRMAIRNIWLKINVHVH